MATDQSAAEEWIEKNETRDPSGINILIITNPAHHTTSEWLQLRLAVVAACSLKPYDR